MLYVVESEIGDQDLALQSLRQQHFDTLRPTYVRTRNVRGRLIESQHPLFYNYLFVVMDYLDIVTMRWRLIRRMRGVRKIYCGADERPVPLPDNEATAMLRAYRAPIPVAKALPLLRSGMEVAIRAGALSGSTAKVMEHKAGEEVRLQIFLFNRAMEVFEKREHLELL